MKAVLRFYILVNLQPLSKAWKCETPTLRPSSTSSPPTLTSWSSCPILLSVSSNGHVSPCSFCRTVKHHAKHAYLVFPSVCSHSHQHSKCPEALWEAGACGRTQAQPPYANALDKFFHFVLSDVLSQSHWRHGVVFWIQCILNGLLYTFIFNHSNDGKSRVTFCSKTMIKSLASIARTTLLCTFAVTLCIKRRLIIQVPP